MNMGQKACKFHVSLFIQQYMTVKNNLANMPLKNGSGTPITWMLGTRSYVGDVIFGVPVIMSSDMPSNMDTLKTSDISSIFIFAMNSLLSSNCSVRTQEVLPPSKACTSRERKPQ